MKKLIVKTVAITLALLTVAFVGAYLICATFAPQVLGNVYFTTQSEKLSLKYTEKAYEKSRDISDLATLTERCIVFGNKDKIISYGVSFINDDGYESFILGKGDGYHYYVVGSICSAEYQVGSKKVAIDRAFSNTSEYVSLNPVHKLIILSAQSNDTATLTEIKIRLQNKQNKNQLVNDHLNLIDELIN